MTAIYKRELRSYLNSMIGWVFMACVMLFIGIYFYVYNMFYGYPYFSVALNGTLFIFMLVVPILTMRSLAEERHSRTDQLLLTAPVSVTKIVLGKFFAMVTLFGAVCLISCLCPFIIKSYGKAFFGRDFGAIVMYFLLGCCYIAIGEFLSSLTESQIIAAVASYAVFILLYLVPGLASAIPGTASVSLIGFGVIILVIALIYYAMTKNWFVSLCFGAVGIILLCVINMIKPALFENALPSLLQTLTLTTGFSDAANTSILSVGEIVRYLSIIFFFCFLSVQSIQKRRWS